MHNKASRHEGVRGRGDNSCMHSCVIDLVVCTALCPGHLIHGQKAPDTHFGEGRVGPIDVCYVPLNGVRLLLLVLCFVFVCGKECWPG